MGIPVMKPVCGYEGYYSVTNKGEIFSHLTNKWLKPSLMTNGYKSVELFKRGKSKRILVHRLVAEAFIANPYNLPFINHKDEDKANNCVSNLEWCTPKYNQNYGTCIERRTASMQRYWASEKHKEDKQICGQRAKDLLGKRVVQKTKKGAIVNEFISVNEAFRETHIRHISEVCNGKRKTAGGYVWQFKGGDDLSVFL